MQTKLIRFHELDKEDRIVVRDTVDDFLVWLDRKRKAVSKKMKAKKKKEAIRE